MYFGADARAGAAAWGASALGYNHRSECTGVSITCMRVCVRACVVSFYGFGRFGPTSVHDARRARPHVRAVHGRIIYGTKVKALPEWLGQCKLLEQLCVRARRRRRRARVCGGAGAALLPRALPRRALGRHHAALDAAAAALPVVAVGRAPGAWLGPAARPARVKGGAGAARRGRTGGAQVGTKHRARGAAGGGRLAQAEGTVSAPTAAFPRPAECARAWRACARTRRAPLGTCVCVHMCVRVRARGGSGLSLCASLCIYIFVFYACTYVQMYVCRYVCMHECMYRLPFECARVRVRECVRPHTRGSRARPLDGYPYVHECMRMHMHIDICIGAYLGPVSTSARVRECARARRERCKRASATWVSLCTYIYIYKSLSIYVYIYIFL
jgi:hypothetical protein